MSFEKADRNAREHYARAARYERMQRFLDPLSNTIGSLTLNVPIFAGIYGWAVKTKTPLPKPMKVAMAACVAQVWVLLHLDDAIKESHHAAWRWREVQSKFLHSDVDAPRAFWEAKQRYPVRDEDED